MIETLMLFVSGFFVYWTLNRLVTINYDEIGKIHWYLDGTVFAANLAVILNAIF
jgi:hypothetical protein